MEVTIDSTGSENRIKYKFSDVHWIDDVPVNWQTLPLCVVATLKSVTNCPDRELLSVYLDKGVIRFTDAEEKRTNVTSLDLSNYQTVDPGDLVLNNQQAWRGSVGVSKLVGIVSPAYLVLHLSKAFDTDFANYLFRDSHMVSNYLVCSKGVGTIQRNLYWPQLRRVKILVPPIREQTLIARFLDRKTAQIDKAIAQKEKLIELLKERRQILIHNAVTKGLNPNAKMKDSGVEWIGEIPEHWEVKKLKYLSIVQSGVTLGKTYYGNNLPKFPYLRVANVQSGYFKLDEIAEITLPRRDADKYFVKRGDILVTEGGDLDKLGRGTVWMGQIENCLHQNHIFAIRVDTSVVAAEYASVLLESDYGRRYFTSTANKTTNLASTNSTKLGNFPLIIPPLNEQQCIYGEIERKSSVIATVISCKENEIGKLLEYKSTLINSAVTGKIKVPDLETMD